MTFDITEFKKHGIGDNPPRPCLFKVEINDIEGNDRIPFLCAELVHIYNAEIGTNELDLTFYETENNYVLNFLKKISKINVYIKHTTYAKDGEILEQTVFPDCTLQCIETGYSWADTNSILTRKVSFYSYADFYSVE